MAPEQARGEWPRIDFRTDVFGLGALLYTLLTGQAPYSGASREEILGQAKRGEFKRPREIDSTIPIALETVCLKAMATAPENRYATAREFATALTKASRWNVRAVRLTSPGRWLLLASAAAAVLIAIGFWGWANWSANASGSVSQRETAAIGRALHGEIVVEHFKETGDGRSVRPVGTVSETSLRLDHPRLEDLIRIHVKLTRPAYVYLIALNPDGKDQLCVPGDANVAAHECRELDFPANPDEYFELNDGVGLQAFVVVASDRPFPPYAQWVSEISDGVAWAADDRDGFWRYDGAALSDGARFRGTLRGKIVSRELAPKGLNGLCDRLRQMPGVSLVSAVAFPVRGERDDIR
jgi:hypothetical protein